MPENLPAFQPLRPAFRPGTGDPRWQLEQHLPALETVADIAASSRTA